MNTTNHRYVVRHSHHQINILGHMQGGGEKLLQPLGPPTIEGTPTGFGKPASAPLDTRGGPRAPSICSSRTPIPPSSSSRGGLWTCKHGWRRQEGCPGWLLCGAQSVCGCRQQGRVGDSGGAEGGAGVRYGKQDRVCGLGRCARSQNCTGSPVSLFLYPCNSMQGRGPDRSKYQLPGWICTDE